MYNSIAIRRENIDSTEKRSPFSPIQISQLIKDYQINVIVEPWDRHFDNEQFRKAGASISSKINDANIIFGVKEIPLKDLPKNKPCVFFSHTIKGQEYNMPLLKKILKNRVTLIDYEKVTDDSGKRLIFFGPYAGLVGAINAIWLLGQRLDYENIKNPFSMIKQATNYNSLDEAKAELIKVHYKILSGGLPQTGKPLVFAISGAGTVSVGAQEILDILPVTEISPVQFLDMQKNNAFDLQKLYKVIIDCDNFVKPVKPNNTFSWDDYFNHPENYEADFVKYLPDITVLINGIYWDKMYPKLVTKQDVLDLFTKEKQPNLRVIADITSDVEGSIECNIQSTSSDNPAYVYNPFSKTLSYGVEGSGPVILAVDKLPSELPGEATQFFGKALMPFIPDLARANWTKTLNELDIPDEFKGAIITHQGNLTPDYKYLESFIK
jgi:alanine dehydrogenase